MDIRQKLLQNNPFASTAAANPWGNSSPDIPLNDDVRDQIFYLIQSKAQEPQTPMAGLIIGEAGSGKTHMQKRILARIDTRTIFANIRAFSVPETVMRDMWHEIFVNLLKRRGEKNFQFSFIAGTMMNLYRKHNALNGVSAFDRVKGVQYFQNELPGIHADFLKAVFAYCDPFSEERHEAAGRWFNGDSDDELPVLLGVRDRAPMSAGELEAEAEQMILSLGLILQHCGMSMVVCFDQLDAMEDKGLINAWGKAAAFLINDAVSMLPLAFLKDSTWRKFFLPSLADYAVQRFTGNRYILKNCTLEQAHELLRRRLSSLFGEEAEGMFAWLSEQLDGKLKPGYSPRIILNLANNAILNPVMPEPGKPALDILSAMEKEYREECDKVAANFVMWQSDAKRLQNALEIYLTYNAGFTAIEPSSDKYISLTGRQIPADAPERECAFIINTARHWKTACTALNRGASLLKDGKSCCYFTDVSFPTSWKTTHEALANFKQLGGTAFFLTQEQEVSWHGLAEFSLKVKSGDVTFVASGGEVRTASMDDFKLYMEQSFKINFLTEDTPDSSQPINKDELVKILSKSPMRLMSVELLLSHLAVPVTREKLLEFLGELGGHGGKFSIFPSGDSTLVMLNKC